MNYSAYRFGLPHQFELMSSFPLTQFVSRLQIEIEHKKLRMTRHLNNIKVQQQKYNKTSLQQAFPSSPFIQPYSSK